MSSGRCEVELLQWFGDLIFWVAYVSAAGSFPEPLSAEEERQCIERMAQGDLSARETLIEHNLRLVAHIARKYAKAGRDCDDLISIGAIGLIKAVTTYDPTKGVALSSYASRCVENEILMSIRVERKQVSGCRFPSPSAWTTTATISRFAISSAPIPIRSLWRWAAASRSSAFSGR